MQLKTADYVGLLIYLGLMVWVAWMTRRTPRFYDYALADRRLPAFLLFASLAATYIGPGFTMGAVDKGATTGIYTFLLFLPFALQTFLVGVFLAPRLAKYSGCATIGDVMGKVYNRETQVLAGVCSVGVCMMFAAYLAKVGGILLEQVTGLSFTSGVVVFTVAAVFYTVYGGLKATVLTDTIQFIIFALVIPFIALAAFFHPSFDVHRASTAVIDLSHQAWTKDTILGMTGVALAFLLV